jgi:hypothetical protein
MKGTRNLELGAREWLPLSAVGHRPSARVSLPLRAMSDARRRPRPEPDSQQMSSQWSWASLTPKQEWVPEHASGQWPAASRDQLAAFLSRLSELQTQNSELLAEDRDLIATYGY